MDYVNVQVAIGGDGNNTVPKFRVPVSEIPVLAAIHGPDALTDFEQCDAPDDAEDLSNRDEMQRLFSIYGRVEDGNGDPVLRQVYPGAGAKVVTSIDDLDIPEGAMKVTERASVKKKASAKKSAAEAKAEADAEAAVKAQAKVAATAKALTKAQSEAADKLNAQKKADFERAEKQREEMEAEARMDDGPKGDSPDVMG